MPTLRRAAPRKAPRSRWRRVPQVLFLGAVVAGTSAYSVAGDEFAASAGEVRAVARAGTVVLPDPGVGTSSLGGGAAAGPGFVEGEDGLLRVREEDPASRAGDRSPLPGCDGVPPETLQPNGDLDEGYLCTLWDGETRMRADAAVALTLLAERYRAELGTDICLTSGYRSYGEQEALRRQKPALAAPAGTSEHGNGLAVDICGGVEAAGPGYDWLRANAPALGFDNPEWARSGGSGPYEPWHWEYVAGQW